MNIMTIDPGKRKTGIFVSADGINRSYLIDNRKEKNTGDMYLNISEGIKVAVKKHNIDVVFMEDYPFSLRGAQIVTTAEVKGVITTALRAASKKIKIIPLGIQVWKQYVDKEILGKRGKVKPYKAAVKELHGWDFKTEDECDAYFMMVAVMMIRKGIIKSDSVHKIYNIIKEIEVGGNK